MKTRVITATAEGHIDPSALSEAALCLREGGLVVFPTETVYGLGGNATDPQAAGKIYAAKGRPADNPLIVHIEDPQDASHFAVTSSLYDRLAGAFMPGPLTVVLPVRELIPKTVTAGLSTVAIRCPAHPVARALIKAAGVPIAAPSANLSGTPSPTSCEHVREDMDGRVDYIIDGGASAIGLESTIVKPEEDGSLTLLRPGAITVEDLSAIAPVRVADAVLGLLKQGERPLSPGMKYKHYAPATPFYLLDGAHERFLAYVRALPHSCAAFVNDEDVESLSGVAATLIPVGKRSEPAVLAHKLFYLLRDLDKRGYTAIYAATPSRDGLGLALYNRMIRAAAHNVITL